MIEGCVNDALEPVMEIGLKQGEAVTTILATLDTGFSGALCLAEQHVDRLDMTFVYAERYELANGEIIAKEVFKGTVVFDGARGRGQSHPHGLARLIDRCFAPPKVQGLHRLSSAHPPRDRG